MKLRLLNNSIRLRLTVAEVETLASGKTVSAALSLPSGTTFRYEVCRSAEPSATADFDGEVLRILAPVDDLSRWGNSDEVSLAYTLGSAPAALTVSIEKDFRCLTPRAGEDEAALFPHPDSDSVQGHGR